MPEDMKLFLIAVAVWMLCAAILLYAALDLSGYFAGTSL